MIKTLRSKKTGRGYTATSASFVPHKLGAVFIAGVVVGMIPFLFTATTFRVDNCEAAPERHVQTTEAPLSGDDNNNNDDDGWNTLNIFYGATDYYEEVIAKENEEGKIFYSQVKQDQVVLDLLGGMTNGFFVDLAANQAMTLSNSYALERHYGWKGLCIEPNPMYWRGLTHIRRSCTLVGAVIGTNRMDPVDFVFDRGELGGIVGKNFDNKEPKRSSALREYTVPLAEIFPRFETPRVIDYMSLDVEGAESLVMQAFPFGDYKIRILTVERPKADLRTLLEGHGYRQIAKLSSWGETLWVHADAEVDVNKTRLAKFAGVVLT